MVEVNPLLKSFREKTGPRYSIQNNHVSAVHAILSWQTFGGQAPNAEGIIDPKAAVAVPIASQTLGIR